MFNKKTKTSTLFVFALLITSITSATSHSTFSLRANTNTASATRIGNKATTASTSGTSEVYEPNTPLHKKMAHEYTPFITRKSEQEDTPETLQQDINTIDLTHPADACNECQEFFKTLVFPDLLIRKRPCQPKDINSLSGNMKNYCGIWNRKMHGDTRGSLNDFFKDITDNDDNSNNCHNSLALDVCVEIKQCTETPCDICQETTEKAATLAYESAFKGLSPILEHFEKICLDASNPSIKENLLRLEKKAMNHMHFLQKYQADHRKYAKALNFTKTRKPNIFSKFNVNKCNDLGDIAKARKYLTESEIEWGSKGSPSAKKIHTFCKKIGLCNKKDRRLMFGSCRLPEKTIDKYGNVHEGAYEAWTNHNVATTSMYKYKAKVTQKGQQTVSLFPRILNSIYLRLLIIVILTNTLLLLLLTPTPTSCYR